MDPIVDFVQGVERRLGGVLAGERLEQGGVLAEASRCLCVLGGGKRVRARLVFLLGQAAGAPARALEDVAAAGELIHGASLLHDDVVDEAPLRRGRPTANARWGNAVAVLAGDWLLSGAFCLLEAHDRRVTTEAIEVVAQMSRAACLELESRGRLDLSLADWRAIAEGKTGALFAWCGRAAALLAGREDLAEPFDGFGRRLGVAFQLADDLKDLVGGDPSKERFADLKSATPSMPILWATQRSAEARAVLEAAFHGERPGAEILAAGEKLIEIGAHRAAAQALEREAHEALACLSVLGEASWMAEIEELAGSFAGACLEEAL